MNEHQESWEAAEESAEDQDAFTPEEEPAMEWKPTAAETAEATPSIAIPEAWTPAEIAPPAYQPAPEHSTDPTPISGASAPASAPEAQPVQTPTPKSTQEAELHFASQAMATQVQGHMKTLEALGQNVAQAAIQLISAAVNQGIQGLHQQQESATRLVEEAMLRTTERHESLTKSTTESMEALTTATSTVMAEVQAQYTEMIEELATARQDGIKSLATIQESHQKVMSEAADRIQ
ncbi:MAG: hypothetical protein M3418_05950, partial [Gemmatimonadota bacterium]|nr:hypothetical protein [Gemmatimonadota bacterium]